jgi:hypothetical protein
MASMGRYRSSGDAHVTRVRLDVIRSEAGRLSGRLVTDGGATDVAFDGTLELLRLLEDLVDDEPAPRTQWHPGTSRAATERPAR